MGSRQSGQRVGWEKRFSGGETVPEIAAVVALSAVILALVARIYCNGRSRRNGPTLRNGWLMADPRDKPEDDGPEARASIRNLGARRPSLVLPAR